MIKMFKAKSSGNGYVPYGDAFVFNDMVEAEDFAKRCVGRYFAYEVLSNGSLSDQHVFIDPFRKTLDQQIRDADQKKDKYLQSLYDTLTMCDLVIQNRQVLGDGKVQQAKKLKAETEQRIQKRESIPFDRRS